MIRFTLLVCLLILLSCKKEEAKDQKWKNEKIEVVNFEQLEAILSQKDGKIRIVNFWATWCQQCVRSIPVLIELSIELKKEDVNFVGISVDGTRNQLKIKPFAQSMGITYPVLRDVNSDLMADLGISAVPTLLVYDSEGTIVRE